MTAKAKIKAQSLIRQMRIYDSFHHSSDLWVAQESSKLKVGDVLLFFTPAKEAILETDAFDLEVDNLALIYREDAGSCMSYLLDDEAYKMSSMEEILSSKSSAVKQYGLALLYLKARLAKPLSKEQIASIAGMEKAYSDSGLRMTESLLDPLYFFLYSLKVKMDAALREQAISLKEFAIAIWSPSDSAASTTMPGIAEYFESDNPDDPHNLAVNYLKARIGSASVSEPVGTGYSFWSADTASSPTSADPFASTAFVSNIFVASASAPLGTSGSDLFGTYEDPFAATASPEASSIADPIAAGQQSPTIDSQLPDLVSEPPELDTRASSNPVLSGASTQLNSAENQVIAVGANTMLSTESTLPPSQPAPAAELPASGIPIAPDSPSLAAGSEQIETAAREIYLATIEHIKDEQGVHAETAVAAISAVCAVAFLQAYCAEQANTSQGSAIDKINQAVLSILAHFRRLLDDRGVEHSKVWSAEIPARHAPKHDPFKLAQELKAHLLKHFNDLSLTDEQVAQAACLALANLICDCQEVLPASVSVLIVNSVIVHASKSVPPSSS